MKGARLMVLCAAMCLHSVGVGVVHGAGQDAGQKAAPARPATAAPATPKAVPPRSPAAPKPAVSHAAPTQELNAVVKRYCVSCHNYAKKINALSLASFDVNHAAQNAEAAEKMIVKLRAGFMPPPLAARPDAATHLALVTTL